MASATANQAPAEAAQSAPTRRKTYRAPYKSRFAGFDDFDPSQLSKAQPGDEDGIGVDSPVQESTPANGTSHDESQQAGPSQSARGNARKRPASPDEDDFIDEIIPAAAASKRRKLEEQRRNGSGNAAGAPAPRPKSAAVQAAEKFRKAREKAEKGGEIDLLALARSKVEEQEEKARREAEDLQEAMAGADINEKLDPAVEEMEMPAPRERETFASGEAGERWNDRWNGRKNFKRFKKVRKRGTQNDAPSRPSRVIVGMEEAKNKDLGIGEEYWLESGSKNSSRKNRDSAFATQRTSQQTSQSVTQRGDRQKGGDQQEKRRGAAKRVVEEDDIEPDDVELDDAPRSGSRGTQGEVARGKRKADGPPEAEERQATKRRTTMRSRRDDDDSDESGDDLRFRLRKK